MKKGEILAKSMELYGDKYDYSLVTDANTNDNVDIICKIHGKFTKRLCRFLRGSGCPKCSGKVRKTFDEFKAEAAIVHNGFYTYDDDSYINSHTKIGITCPIHGIFYQTPTNHLNGNGCPKCKTDKLREQFSSNTDEFIAKSEIIHNNEYTYDKTSYKNNSSPLLITCKKHGDFWQLPHNHLQGKGCPMCNESKLEKEVAILFDRNGISYERQWHLPWNRKYTLDFYIEECNIGIECQGVQHFEDGHFKNVSLEEIEKRDRYKLQTCNENGIRILYFSDKERENCISDENKLINEIYGSMMDKKEKFIEKSERVHGGKYDYSKVDYVDSLTKVCIICKEHGEFWQTPQAHARGNGCPKCANKKRGDTFRSDGETFIEKANVIHNGKYLYDKDRYVNAMTKVPILCLEHGTFWMTPMAHLNGQGCPKCSGRGLNTDEVIQLFKEKHGDKYDYSKVTFNKMHEKVCIICPIHGEFLQTPSKHLMGQGCPKCGAMRRSSEKKLKTSDFIKKSEVVHNGKYIYDKTEYKGAYEYVTITCPIHGDFKQRANDHLNGHGCPICGKNMSIAEKEIEEYINSLGIETESKKRGILKDNKEIDILMPKEGIGIEYNGLKWHCDEFKDKNYHLDKTKECKENGIRLIHIFEDEWVNKQDIIKSMLSNILGKTENKVYARKCEIREVDKDTKSKFLDDSHIQGNVSSEINLGLYYNNELVSLMSFGKPRINLGRKSHDDNEYELLRFCNKLNTSVIGGASKLFKHFIEKYNPSSITSYCDRRWSIGGMYETLGFEFSHYSSPNYYYIIGNNRKNRFKYRKSELVKEGYDPNKTEREIMSERGIHRIYDCGTIVYKWFKKS